MSLVSGTPPHPGFLLRRSRAGLFDERSVRQAAGLGGGQGHPQYLLGMPGPHGSAL